MRIVAGRWKGRRIRAPKGRDVRPTGDRVKEAWMSMLGNRVVGARVVDLFAGSGALGLECLSRGAEHVVFVDRSTAALKAIRANVTELGADEGAFRIVRDDVRRFVAGSEKSFDIALADPPYGRGLASRLLVSFRERPFAGELWIEHDSGETLPDLAGLESRRYGDTMITRIEAGAIPSHSQAREHP